jgi:hypothetical protein
VKKKQKDKSLRRRRRRREKMSGKSTDKFYQTVVYAEDMTDMMLEKVIATAREAFQLQVTVSQYLSTKKNKEEAHPSLFMCIVW